VRLGRATLSTPFWSPSGKVIDDLGLIGGSSSLILIRATSTSRFYYFLSSFSHTTQIGRWFAILLRDETTSLRGEKQTLRRKLLETKLIHFES